LPTIAPRPGADVIVLDHPFCSRGEQHRYGGRRTEGQGRGIRRLKFVAVDPEPFKGILVWPSQMLD
jgi:hypothetical protein